MRIVCLVEDTAGASGAFSEHGLAFYIETAKHRVLFDTGATDAFVANAKTLGIDLTLMDMVIISHGHYDHTGGLLAFSKINPSADIYIHKKALGEFYNTKHGQPKYIGADKRIADIPSLTFTEGDTEIDGELSLFSGASGTRLMPRGNGTLKEKCCGELVVDSFSHEQYLRMVSGEAEILVSGCAHRGIVNILDAYKEKYGKYPTHVIGGLHTLLPEYTDEDTEIIQKTADELCSVGAKLYVGHCTGEYALGIFKEKLGERIHMLRSGIEIEL